MLEKSLSIVQLILQPSSSDILRVILLLKKLESFVLQKLLGRLLLEVCIRLLTLTIALQIELHLAEVVHHHHGGFLVASVENEESNVILELVWIYLLILCLCHVMVLVLIVKVFQLRNAALVLVGSHAQIPQFLNYTLGDLVLYQGLLVGLT